jgi:hypothetical protein
MAIGPQVPPPNPADVDEPSNATLAVAFYNAARAEVLQRLNMRETTFLAWITVVGAILSFAARKSPGILFEPRLLQLIPLLCLPFGLAIYRHSMIIAYLGAYLRKELGGCLRQVGNSKDPETPRHWDNSRTQSKEIGRFTVIEGVAYTFFLAGVPICCLVYLRRVADLPWTDWWLLCGSACAAVVFFFGVYSVVRDTLWARRLAKTK